MGGLTPREDAERARVVREAGGDDFVLACDANQGWTRAEAVEFLRYTADLNLAWFEEPCHWDNDRADLAVVLLTHDRAHRGGPERTDPVRLPET